MHRFNKEIEIIAEFIQLEVLKHQEIINQKLERFLELHFNNFSGLIEIIEVPLKSTSRDISAAAAEDLQTIFNLNFNSQLSQLLVQIFSSTPPSFRDPKKLFNKEKLQFLLQSSPFIEINQGERYHKLQQIKLMERALQDLSTLRFNAQNQVSNDFDDTIARNNEKRSFESDDKETRGGNIENKLKYEEEEYSEEEEEEQEEVEEEEEEEY